MDSAGTHTKPFQQIVTEAAEKSTRMPMRPARKYHFKACLHSWLKDGDTRVELVGPLGVVVGTGTLCLAPEAAPMLLLDGAAVVVEGNTSVLLRAWVVPHLNLALLILHDVRVRAPGTRILLHLAELLCPSGGKGTRSEVDLIPDL